MDTIQLKKDLMRDEGWRGRPYKCTAGKTTIGYGHNLDDNPLPKEIGELLLEHDMRLALLECDTFPWFHKLTHARKCAIANMMYQLGRGRFMGFRKMIAALEKGDYEEAARQAEDSKWARSDSPARAARVIQNIRQG